MSENGVLISVYAVDGMVGSYGRTEAGRNHFLRSVATFYSPFRGETAQIASRPSRPGWSTVLTAWDRTVVSPMRQSPMRGAVKHAIFQGYQRTLSQAPYFLVPIVIGQSCVHSTVTVLLVVVVLSRYDTENEN